MRAQKFFLNLIKLLSGFFKNTPHLSTLCYMTPYISHERMIIIKSQHCEVGAIITLMQLSEEDEVQKGLYNSPHIALVM